jgi:hypothetical protein
VSTRETIRDELLTHADDMFCGTKLDDIWSEDLTQEAIRFLPGDTDVDNFPDLVSGVLDAFLVYLATRVYDTDWILDRLQEWEKGNS